jgi:hypothetical protein
MSLATIDTYRPTTRPVAAPAPAPEPAPAPQTDKELIAILVKQVDDLSATVKQLAEAANRVKHG